MPPTYQSAVDREMEMLFGTANRATAVLLHSVCSNYLCNAMCISRAYHVQNDVAFMSADHGGDGSVRIFTFIRPPIEHLWQVTRTPENVRLKEAHSCLATASCQWIGEGNSGACGAPITCKSVPAHFRNTHGIKKLRADTPIYCWWEGCHGWVKRKYFVRHIRECHLGHSRKVKLR